ncbi:S41 family peptidase [Caulobacter endophyticus]|uniref:S41 family peptidase n=1 Tax=Caulobacter endophyticus TaxID=2172652 RepID=UPI00240FE1A2|nr:S41 family peptidase [Caulobacter endophyticus]MDG2527337.1 S41 family peptidase [Caulobacter endophyticus]
MLISMWQYFACSGGGRVTPGFLRCGLAAALVLLVAGPVAAEAPPSIALTAAQAREDLELAIAAVEAGLPDIYWRQSRRSWSQAKARARRQVAGVADSRQLYAVLRPLVSRTGEGHLSLRRSAALVAHERAQGRFLPLDLHFSQDGVFVVRGFGEAAGIPRGTRLLAIQGEGVEALVQEAMAGLGTDGAIPTGAMREAGGQGYARLRYRLRGPERRFRLKLRTADGAVVERAVAAIGYFDRPALNEPEPSPLARLDWLDERTAYLSVPSFSNRRYRAEGASFERTIQALFEQIDRRDARDLILDLRENGGGSEPNESILFSHLVARPIRKYASVEARGRALAVTDLSGRRYEHVVFDDEELAGQRLGVDGRLYRRDGLMSRPAPATPVFGGRLVVLISGDTFSGGAELASMLRHVRRGVFVGEEVGGTQDGNTSGYGWELVLPNSKLELDVPLLRFRHPWRGERRDRGVMPDCPVPPRVDEIGQARDAAWRVAVSLLKQNWKAVREARCPPA